MLRKCWGKCRAKYENVLPISETQKDIEVYNISNNYWPLYLLMTVYEWERICNLICSPINISHQGVRSMQIIYLYPPDTAFYYRIISIKYDNMIWLYLELDKYMLPYNICNLLDIFMSTIGGSSLSTSTFYIKTYKNRK